MAKPISLEAIKLRKTIFESAIARLEATQAKKGKKRAEALMDYLCGACTALIATDNPLAHNLEQVLVFLISTRGESEVIRMIEQDAKLIAKGGYETVIV